MKAILAKLGRLSRVPARPVRKWTISFAILTAGVLTSAAMLATAPEYAAEIVEEKVVPVAVMRAQPADGVPQVQLYGRVDTPRRAQLTAAAAASVQQVLIREGQFVSAGDQLLRLDDSDIKLEIKQREADVRDTLAVLQRLRVQQSAERKMLQHQEQLYALTRAKIARREALHNDKLISSSELDESRAEGQRQAIALEQQKNAVASQPHQLESAQAKVQRARALLEQAQLDLSRTRVLAPFDGAISELHVSLGDRVGVGSALMSLFDTSALEVRAAIPAQYLTRLRQVLERGQAVTARAQVEGWEVVLKLNQLTARVAAGRSGIDGLFQVVTRGAPLALGRVLNLEVAMPAEHSVVAVPVDAVYDNRRIYMVEDERLKAVDVQVVGETETGGLRRLLVRADTLNVGGVIVTTPLSQATSGLKVSVLES